MSSLLYARRDNLVCAEQLHSIFWRNKRKHKNGIQNRQYGLSLGESNVQTFSTVIPTPTTEYS
jgi:hypothetical protein